MFSTLPIHARQHHAQTLPLQYGQGVTAEVEHDMMNVRPGTGFGNAIVALHFGDYRRRPRVQIDPGRRRGIECYRPRSATTGEARYRML